MIKHAQLFPHEDIADLRIEGGTITGIGPELKQTARDRVTDASGATLLPGLHDHHIHLLAMAASLNSLRCGPPDIENEEHLATVLREQNRVKGGGWVRGIGYHPCVAGDIDRHWLDRHIPDRPVRIQHRGGRLWVLNSRALRELGVPSAHDPAGLERTKDSLTGRLYEGDQWLRARMQSGFPDLARASKLLASYGVTGITDTSPMNGRPQWQYFQQSQAEGRLLQRVRMMGLPQLLQCPQTEQLQCGEFKIHLLESQLPNQDTLCAEIIDAHSHDRSVAIHCVTLAELIFALSILETAGIRPGDRIEHASIAPPEMLQSIAALGLRVIIQPHFIAERGEQYIADVEVEDQPWLYRAAGFIAGGIPLAGGSDAPFGGADPWDAMRAAVERTTPSGRVMGESEALSPEQALALFLSAPEAPGSDAAKLRVGMPADLCLLDRPWREVRNTLSSQYVRSTWHAGIVSYCSD